MNEGIIQKIAAAVAVLILTGTTARADPPPPGPINPNLGVSTTQLAQATTFIDSLPFTINKPGVYKLSENLTGVAGADGITINSDDVTVDLGGFCLNGVPSSSNGISVTGNRRNVVIRNGSCKNWGNYGINSTSNIPILIEKMKCTDNTDCGIAVADACIKESDASRNGSHGMSFTNPNTKAEIIDCTLTNNGGDGSSITVNASGKKLTVKFLDSHFSHNTGNGLRYIFAAGASGSSAYLRSVRSYFNANGGCGSKYENLAQDATIESTADDCNYSGNTCGCSFTCSGNRCTGARKEQGCGYSQNGNWNCNAVCNGSQANLRWDCRSATHSSPTGGGITCDCSNSSKCRVHCNNCRFDGMTSAVSVTAISNSSPVIIVKNSTSRSFSAHFKCACSGGATGTVELDKVVSTDGTTAVDLSCSGGAMNYTKRSCSTSRCVSDTVFSCNNAPEPCSIDEIDNRVSVSGVGTSVTCDKSTLSWASVRCVTTGGTSAATASVSNNSSVHRTASKCTIQFCSGSSESITCDNTSFCEVGYSDGCNTCSCASGGTYTGCTRVSCIASNYSKIAGAAVTCVECPDVAQDRCRYRDTGTGLLLDRVDEATIAECRMAECQTAVDASTMGSGTLSITDSTLTGNQRNIGLSALPVTVADIYGTKFEGNIIDVGNHHANSVIATKRTADIADGRDNIEYP